ncbi:protease modulator HflC [Amphiplicatus metriothermophilus]|uniref:Protein HflC n=1 Tax=Amphiplicatus metriothermophilus TaxID=1519374 RepID=A0A239PQB5_9PROT|nr:protease modulator HflC [Amphiplicatus metriothermophilus]MBB5518361.1 membrane protease subunit HflC [Amphiplicatus metriothermophilus]SNT72471.1 membrane protease subunit HflC [Amphiplicatus metriothermophilus]
MMRQASIVVVGVIAAIVVFLILNAAFIVPETRSAIVLRFGEPTNVYTMAGLKFKAPVIENVQFIDKRNRELDHAEIEIIASNQERLRVDAFARYRVVDALQFYQAVRTISDGERRLLSLMEDSLRRVLAEVSVDEIVTTQRPVLMRRIRDLFGESARGLGVEIIDVKIRRADLPPQNSQAVFQRMITERQQLAQQIRSEGAEAAKQIRAQADRQATEVLSQAEEEAERIRGAADAERNAVYAAAYGKDPEFFDFYRSLVAYEAALADGETTLVLSPDSEFFRYFNDLRGNRR